MARQSRLPEMFDIRLLLKAARYSLAGLVAAWRYERVFRQEVVLLFLLTPAAVWLGRSSIERVLLVGSLLLVLVVELLNSAIETTLDRIGTKRHALTGRAKDMASAAVLLTVMLILIVWGWVIFDRFVA